MVTNARADRVRHLRGRRRRRHAHQRSRAVERRGRRVPAREERARRSPTASTPTTPRDRRAARPTRPRATRCSCSSASARRDARADRRAGTRSACAAPAAPASSSRAVGPASRSCPSRSPTSRPGRWCPSRTSCGPPSGSASRPTRATAPRAFVRGQAREAPGRDAADGVAPGRASTRLLQLMRGNVARRRAPNTTAMRRAEGDARASPTRLRRPHQQPQDRGLASGVVRDRARRRCSICGIAGYRNDTPFSVGRHLRDALSAALMIGNDRIHATNASLLLVAKEADRHETMALDETRLPRRAGRRRPPARRPACPGVYGRGAVFEDVLAALRRAT